MKKYRIGEFADQMCVTQDFIRFYESKGLIHSEIDPHNNYHYYDISQSEVVYKILQFRNLGYSVNEIQHILRNSTKEEQLSMHEVRMERLRQEQRRCELAIQHLEQFRRNLNTAEGTWFVSMLPPIWFLPHSFGDDYLEDETTKTRYEEWAHFIPTVFSMDKWVINSSGVLQAVYHGRAVADTFAREFALCTEPPVQFYPQRRCIEYYTDFVHDEEFMKSQKLSVSKIQNALNFVMEKDFETDGDVFVRLITLYMKDGLQHEQNIVYIPIK